MGPRPESTNPSAPASLTRRQLQPIITQSFLAELFIEANDVFWRPQYGLNMYYYAYCRAQNVWHKCRETGGYLDRGCGCWIVDQYGAPLEDYKPGVFFDLRRLLAPLLDVASAAEQRPCGSYAFLNGVVKLLERDARIVIGPEGVCYPPRPCRDQEAEERHA